MTTKLPRIALSLSPELRTALGDLAEATDKPVSKVIVELLGAALPQIQGLAKVHKQLKAGNHALAKRAVTDMLGDTMGELAMRSQPDLFKGKKGSK